MLSRKNKHIYSIFPEARVEKILLTVFLSLPQTDDQQNKIQGSLVHRNAGGTTTEKPATAWKWEEEMDILQTVHQLQE